MAQSETHYPHWRYDPHNELSQMSAATLAHNETGRKSGRQLSIHCFCYPRTITQNWQLIIRNLFKYLVEHLSRNQIRCNTLKLGCLLWKKSTTNYFFRLRHFASFSYNFVSSTEGFNAYWIVAKLMLFLLQYEQAADEKVQIILEMSDELWTKWRFRDFSAYLLKLGTRLKICTVC